MTAADDSDLLRLVVDPRRETVVLAAYGEIDMQTGVRLRAELEALIREGFDRVVFDLRGVSFMDSTGLKVVLDAHAAVQGTRTSFVLIAGPHAVQHVFDIAGVTTALTFVDSKAIG